MRYLIDVNVLIALLDAAHIDHQRAHDWFLSEGRRAWATCPIVQNGVARIMGGPGYSKSPGPPSIIFSTLRVWMSMEGHEFWPEDFSLAGTELVEPDLILGSKQITDTYLLALAVRRGGKLATLDRRLSPRAVRGGAAALRLIET